MKYPRRKIYEMSRVWPQQFVVAVIIADMNGLHLLYEYCCVETAVYYCCYQVDYSHYYEELHLEVSMANETFACWTKYFVFYSFLSDDHHLLLLHHYHRSSRCHENYYRYQTTQLESQDMISIANEIEWNVSSIFFYSVVSWILFLGVMTAVDVASSRCAVPLQRLRALNAFVT